MEQKEFKRWKSLDLNIKSIEGYHGQRDSKRFVLQSVCLRMDLTLSSNHQQTVEIPKSFIPLLSHNNPADWKTECVIKIFQDPLLTRKQSIRGKQEELREKYNMLLEEIKKLDKEYETLDKQTFVCDVILSPFRRLPDDIIYQLTERCPIDLSLEPKGKNAPPHFPCVLAKTSRVFHATIPHSPNCWRDIRFSASEWGSKTLDRFKKHLSHFGRRSGSQSLSLVLKDISCVEYAEDSESELEEEVPTLGGEMRNHDKEGFIRALSWLLSTWTDRERLTRLTLKGPKPLSLLQVMRAVEKRGTEIPKLGSVALLWEGLNKTGEGLLGAKTLPKFLELQSTIQRLWLDRTNDEDSEAFPLDLGNILGLNPQSSNAWASFTPQTSDSWTNMTRLYMGPTLCAITWQDVLRICPNLEAAWFHLMDASPHLKNKALVHPNIKELSVTLVRFTNDILRPYWSLQMPNLKKHTVYVNSGCKLHAYSSEPLITFAETLFPSLETLNLQQADTMSDNAKPLVLLPGIARSVKSFTLTMSYLQVPSLYHIIQAVYPHGMRMMPGLRHLTLQFMPTGLLTPELSESHEESLQQLILNLYKERTEDLAPQVFQGMLVEGHVELESLTLLFRIKARDDNPEFRLHEESKTMKAFLLRLRKLFKKQNKRIYVEIEEDVKGGINAPGVERFMQPFLEG